MYVFLRNKSCFPVMGHEIWRSQCVSADTGWAHTLHIWNEEISFFLAFNLRCLDSNEPVTWLSLDHHPLSCFQAGCRNILSPSKLKRKRCQPACTSNVKKKNWMWLKVLGKNCNRLAQNHPSLTENSEGYVHGTNSPQYWENRRDPWFNESLLNFSK